MGDTFFISSDGVDKVIRYSEDSAKEIVGARVYRVDCSCGECEKLVRDGYKPNCKKISIS